jgi:cell division protein FtsX
VGLWLNLTVALVAVLILFNSINLNLHAHKHEIKVMQLVGAKHSFIKAGYLFEGLIYSVFALGLSIAISRGVLGYLTHNLINVIQNESLLVGLNSILYHFEDQFWFTLMWQVFVAIGVGFISSMLAIHLYLRNSEN